MAHELASLDDLGPKTIKEQSVAAGGSLESQTDGAFSCAKTVTID